MKALLASLSWRWVLGAGILACLVWLTVGIWAALGAVLLLVWDRWISPGRKVLANATVVLFVAIPVVWLLGTGVALNLPSQRLQDNVAAHQLGGLAMWMLCVAVLLDLKPRERAQR
ncbi:hypothetical protein JNB_03750 [Janibacter sp. HTCC2649]|uniref:hypothetical protein n=1 Tax=Janibacter sp. HTCC2649 TaxID=313589 RepID=UPI000066EBBC|nr:hypothetical protein [Janibacter sp. HTCC2649]EAP99252.1 hypothetical protein JNB_03750 [Janibacter sp. HTCC2649]